VDYLAEAQFEEEWTLIVPGNSSPARNPVPAGRAALAGAIVASGTAGLELQRNASSAGGYGNRGADVSGIMSFGFNTSQVLHLSTPTLLYIRLYILLL
jgi:hypothetical protein